jgi:hypothetical protein
MKVSKSGGKGAEWLFYWENCAIISTNKMIFYIRKNNIETETGMRRTRAQAWSQGIANR